MNKSLKINAILNTVRMSLKIIFPLITFPYVARILGTQRLGQINYVQSIINYMVLIADLGISTYAVRECAKIRSNKEKTERFCNEIFTIKYYNDNHNIYIVLYGDIVYLFTTSI